MNRIQLYKQFVRLKGTVRSCWNRWLLRWLGVKVGRQVRFEGAVRLIIDGDPGRIIIGDHVVFRGAVLLKNRENGRIVIHDDCVFEDGLRLVAARDSSIEIGARTGTGQNLIINAGADVIIGEDCLFSSHINIHSSQHRCVAGQTVLSQGYVQELVTLGNDVWLASGVNILWGTTVGDGSVCAPNSTLCGSYPADSINIGTPAVTVSKRTDSLAPLHEMTDLEIYAQKLCGAAES